MVALYRSNESTSVCGDLCPFVDQQMLTICQLTGPFNAEMVRKLPKSLKYICHNGAGYDNIDITECSLRGQYPASHIPSSRILLHKPDLTLIPRHRRLQHARRSEQCHRRRHYLPTPGRPAPHPPSLHSRPRFAMARNRLSTGPRPPEQAARDPRHGWNRAGSCCARACLRNEGAIL